MNNEEDTKTSEHTANNEVDKTLSDSQEAEQNEAIEEVYEMEIAEDEIYAYLFDEDDNEIGFILKDENGDEQEYYYVDTSEYEVVSDKSNRSTKKTDEDDFDLGITREGVAEATADVNAIYKDGIELAAELKSTFEEISEEMSFLKKKK